MSATRSKCSIDKKRRRLKVMLAVLSLCLLFTAGFTAYEYLAGKQQALSQQSHSPIKPDIDIEDGKKETSFPFHGEPDPEGALSLLLLGTDQRNAETARTDTIMILRYHPERKSLKLASIMRDTYVKIPGHGSNKINAAYALGGPELLRKTIAQNFDIPLEHYAMVDFSGFSHIIDTIAPGGLEVSIKKDLNYQSEGGDTVIDLNKGVQKLDGEELLAYSRFRSDSEGDFGRVERQQEVLSLLKEQLLSIESLWKVPRLLGSIQPYVDTDAGNGMYMEAAKDYFLHPPEKLKTIRIPTNENVWNERKPYPTGLVLNHDQDQTREDLKKFLYEQEE
ncbi:transcriptional attenuator, LytR family [Halobacillus alkaliphilus]|uniref:Regulatory protein MsrR n=1 Tax=Halobacillus alkaliphilus TaxID=396056 RepID=A0A1I2L4F8_9BACI|nr:LCP family protein [Halobacillus alkaliphilus]SFF74214.1 transcriptional attenuator, LytR family [Halobacillus alkaliphilus]